MNGTFPGAPLEVAIQHHRRRAQWFRERAALYDQLGRHELAEQAREDARRLDRLADHIDAELNASPLHGGTF